MYMKKWWLKKELSDGRCIEGWINTTANAKEDFPESLSGIFTSWKDDEGTHGVFIVGNDLPFKLLENYEKNGISAAYKELFEYNFGWVYLSCYPKTLALNDNTDSNDIEAVMRSLEPLDTWKIIHGRIEDCLCLDKTYITKF